MAYVVHLRAVHRAEVTRSAETALRHAEDLSRQAESASSDDAGAWADAVASARGARDALAEEPGLEDLRRSAEATLADIERRREGCQSLVPGCLAASNRYRAKTVVPPQVIDHDSQCPVRLVRLFGHLDHAEEHLLRPVRLEDGCRRHRPLEPPHSGRARAGRTATPEVLDIVRKQHVTADNRRLIFPFRTEGFEVDVRCTNRPYTVRPARSPFARCRWAGTPGRCSFGTW